LEKVEHSDNKEVVQTIHQFYNFDSFEQDAMSWYDKTKKGNFPRSEKQEELEFVDLVKNMELFSSRTSSDDNTTDPARHYLYSRKIIQDDDDRLCGLYMISVHRSRITQTHTHTRLTALFSGTTRLAAWRSG